MGDLKNGRRSLAALTARLARLVGSGADTQATARLSAELADLRAVAVGIEERLAASSAMVEARLQRLTDILQLVYDDEPRQRHHLRLVRMSAAYEEAFTAPEPLVSIAIPTYDGHALLAERSLPSALAQTYRNIEVIVVGDAAPPEAARVVAEAGDPRVSYVNRSLRGPYPDDPYQRWLVAGAPPYNEAVAGARGLWIAPLDDDDAFAPDHVERLLSAARRKRYEVCYGLLRSVVPSGEDVFIGEFPPRLSQFGWQGAIYHAGLRFFEAELADALFGSPADWGMCRRMLRAGVRFGMIDEPVTDHYPSPLWRGAPGAPHADPGVAREAP